MEKCCVVASAKSSYQQAEDDDGHDGVWNIIAELAPEDGRREVLDWYHLVENLYKVAAEKSWLVIS